MQARSFLFVPGDRPERFPKAEASGADALIYDLEDSVVPANKVRARQTISAGLSAIRKKPALVRINPLDSEYVRDDLDMVLLARPDGLMLPKSDGASSIRALMKMAGKNCPPIVPIASETPAAVFSLGSYSEVSDQLAGLTWGAEDLPAAIGATSARNADGSFTSPYEVVRALTLFGAHAAGVAAVETVYPYITDTEGLTAYVARARRDGFTGMMAIHPAQVAIINAGFSPSEAEIDHAREVIAMFAASPGAGALKLGGRMVDRPHLRQAEALLFRAGVLGAYEL